jgi:signal transduction histidine kinase
VAERELPRLLDVGLDRELDYYSEFLDVARFPEPSYQVGFADFLRVKYRGIQFDLVVAMQDIAVEFVNRNRDALFTDTPVVFLANRPVTQRPSNSTGLVHERNFTATLGLIEQLQPEVRNVFVVSGAGASDRMFEERMRTQVREFQSRLAIQYLSGLSTLALERRLATLPERSVVYHLLVTEDGTGSNYHPLEYVDRVAAAANRPTYSWVDSALGHGVVGGNLYSQAAAIRHTGQLALRVLAGEPPARVDISAIDVNAAEVDWRQLRRWGIDQARLPPGTVVRFRQETIWDRYGQYILAALAMLLVQSALIAGLLMQARRRRRAEAELRRSQDSVRSSYDRIRDLGSRLLRAQEAERSRIARELHDDINQQVAVLIMDLELMGGAERSDLTRLSADALERSHGIARSVHDLSHRLHPAKLRLLGLVAALQALCLELSHAGLSITFTHDHVPSRLAAEATLSLFRVVQEALYNAIKYSQASEVVVHLAGSPLGLTVTVVDDGVGFDVPAASASGLGLVSMKERLEAIDGSLEIRSSRGHGTRVEASVPAAIVERGEALWPDLDFGAGPVVHEDAARRGVV